MKIKKRFVAVGAAVTLTLSAAAMAAAPLLLTYSRVAPVACITLLV